MKTILSFFVGFGAMLAWFLTDRRAANWRAAWLVIAATGITAYFYDVLKVCFLGPGCQ
jgi:hypothetical protein